MKTPKQVLEEIKEEKKSNEIMPTGFRKLDNKLLDGGFYRGEIIIIGAYTGVGKSQLAGQILLNIAEQGFKTAYFSLEISNQMILARMIGLKSNIKPSRIRFGLLNKNEQEAKIKAIARIKALNDYVYLYDDTYKIDEVEKELTNNQYDFVVLDFIQNIIGSGKDEYTKLSESVVRLQKLAKKTKTTILIISQVSNYSARAGGEDKVLTYKGSGAIAMVADLGFFLEKNTNEISDINEKYNPEIGTVLFLKKNRRGLSGWKIRLGYTLPGGLIYEK